MKQSLSLLFALIFASWLVLPSHADDHEKNETSLEDQMGDMNSYFKKIRKTEDPVEGAELARLAQETALKSLTFVPTLTKKVEDKTQKAKDIADYKRLTGQTYVAFCEIELAFLEGDLEKVADIVDRLRKLKKQGHKRYIED